MKLTVQNLSVTLDNDAILQGVSLQVEDGEFISLLGTSGCGKTTLLKTISGILSPRSGSVSLGDEDITNLPAHKRGTVVLFQDLRLFPHMTVLENVAFAQKMLGVPKAQRLRDAEEFLSLVQLDGYGHRRVNQLSGGQQQRVALARALAARPKVLLLDEPFSALDEALRQEMRTLVRSLHDQLGMTTVLVTHDKEEALSLSDRVALMSDGKILQYDTPKEIYLHPVCRAAADYFGDGIYIPGTVCSGLFSGDGITTKTTEEDGSYALFLRPSALHTEDAGDYRLTVDRVQFCGSMTKVSFSANDGTRWEKSYSNSCHFRTGDTISCRLDLTDPIFFINDSLED